LVAGQSTNATINLAPSAFEFFDWAQRKMTVTPGEYELLYGNSSDAKDLKSMKITIL
jgi:beta-glucosidase